MFYLLYLSGCSEHYELDGASGVSLWRHGAPQCLHGSVVGAPDQRLPVYRYQLVIYAQPAILSGEDQGDVINKPPEVCLSN